MKCTELTNCFDLRSQYLPNFNGEGFAAGKFVLQKVHIEVEVLVIQFFDDFIANEGAQLLEIDHEAGVGIWFPFYSNDHFEIVTVPVLVRTGTKYLLVFLFRPGRVVELMRGVEVFFAADVDHNKLQIYINLRA